MSCGCGCGCGGRGDCLPHSGMLMTGSYGLHGLQGLGLGDICYAWDDQGNCIASSPDGQASQIPTESPYPVVTTPSYTPATAPSNVSFLDSLAASWSAAAQQILKSQAGALPTYQQVGPGGSTTMYGGGVPNTLQTGLLSATAGSGIWLLAGGALLVFMMLGKK